MTPKMPDWVRKTIFYSNKYGISIFILNDHNLDLKDYEE